MPIDWFTVVAQAVNFLILVVLMRKFLYGPIRRAVEAREKKIQDSLREAADKYTQAAEHEEALKHRHAELEASRDRMMGEARARAESERQALLDAARRDVDAKRTEWLESFARQRDALAADVGRATSLAACDIARRALTDLGDASLEQQVLAAFVRRVGEIPRNDREAFAAAARDAPGGIRVVTSFELSPQQRTSLEAALRSVIGEQAPLDYEVNQGSPVGVSVDASGRRIAWSVDQYLKDAEQRIMATLGADAQRLGAPASTGFASSSGVDTAATSSVDPRHSGPSASPDNRRQARALSAGGERP